MRDKAYQLFAVAAFAAAALIVVLGLGGPAAVLADLGVETQSAADSAPVIAPVESQDAESKKMSARERAAIQAAPGAYGEKSGAGSHVDVIEGARWNPCAPIRFVLNTDNAPAGAVSDFRIALRKVSGATGMDLILEGTTNVYDPDWADVPGRPVLVNWGSGTHGVLSRGAAGTAQPSAWVNASGLKVIDGGQITFSTTEDKHYPGGKFGVYGSRIALYMHEIAHIVGLGHVEDPNQLMFESVDGARDFGAGDLAGLREVTSGPCRTL